LSKFDELPGVCTASLRVKFEAKFDTLRSSPMQGVRGLLANLIKFALFAIFEQQA